jgi:Rps23 Pro-64 3,4-dihydroxylase Tpa1-like proline 4-hydroxylase
MTVGLLPDKIFPDETFAGCIDVFYNALENPDKIIKDLESVYSDASSGTVWTRAEILGDGDKNHRTNLDAGLTIPAMKTGNPTLKKVHNEIYLTILSGLNQYMKKHDILNLWHEPYNVLKYSTGTEYKAHYDGGTETHRSVSVIFYLNESYEGGELEFTNFNLKIKPEAGSMLIFPSNYAYTHIAHPVTDGTKYAIVTWLHDQPMQEKR